MKRDRLSIMILAYDGAEESRIGRFVAANLAEMGFEFRFVQSAFEYEQFSSEADTRRLIVMSSDWDFFLADLMTAAKVHWSSTDSRIAKALNQQEEQRRLRYRSPRLFVICSHGSNWDTPYESVVYAFRNEEEVGGRFQSAFLNWHVDEEF